MFTISGCATSFDLKSDQSNWNWSANQFFSTPYINDRAINDNNGSNTRYYLIKAEANSPKHLLAMRKFGCNSTNFNYIVNLYKLNSI